MVCTIFNNKSVLLTRAYSYLGRKCMHLPIYNMFLIYVRAANKLQFMF